MIFAFNGGLRELIPHCTISRVRLQRVNCNLRAALKIFHHQSQQKWDEDLHLLSIQLTKVPNFIKVVFWERVSYAS
jgi:hypothetical protein